MGHKNKYFISPPYLSKLEWDEGVKTKIILTLALFV
jgi:hypothetical protein